MLCLNLNFCNVGAKRVGQRVFKPRDIIGNMRDDAGPPYIPSFDKRSLPYANERARLFARHLHSFWTNWTLSSGI